VSSSSGILEKIYIINIIYIIIIVENRCSIIVKNSGQEDAESDVMRTNMYFVQIIGQCCAVVCCCNRRPVVIAG
jgi:hypothetical protein